MKSLGKKNFFNLSSLERNVALKFVKTNVYLINFRVINELITKIRIVSHFFEKIVLKLLT